jgi:hypothetical protein
VASQREGDAAVIREDRELLVELARLNGDMASLALRIMDGSASVAEQQHYAQRLIAAGERLQRRVDGLRGVVIEGEIVTDRLPLRRIPLSLTKNREQHLGDAVSVVSRRA